MKPEPIMPTSIPRTAWHTLSIDFSSKLPSGEYTMGILDEHSRKTLVKLSKNMTSETAIKVCMNFFGKYGIPKVIKLDNGPAFSSQQFANFAKTFNFKHQKVTPYHPEANAGSERIMKALNKRARCAAVAHTSWKDEMTQYLHRYNQTPHSSTGFSPNMLLIGQDKCDILPQIAPVRTRTEQTVNQAILNDDFAKAKMKYYGDKYQMTKTRDLSINHPILHLWIRNNKHMSIFDPHPYRVKSTKH